MIFGNDENVTIIMSDEADFHLNGVVNQQNGRYRSPETPRQIQGKSFYSDRIIVWCAVEHYFFDKEEVTITHYVKIIEIFLQPKLPTRRINLPIPIQIVQFLIFIKINIKFHGVIR